MIPKKKQQFKKLVRTIHLWLGLSSGLVVFIVGLTGAMFVFEEEGRELFQHHYYYVAATAAARLPADQLVDSFKTHFPKEKISSIRFRESKDAAFIFFTADKLVSLNPFTGAITGIRYKSKDFFTIVQKIHTQLYMGEVGSQIIKENVLIFFTMCITGLVLWFPKQIKFFRQAIKISFKTKNRKRLVWDLHSVFGFYALAVLLIISCTGMFFTYDTMKDFVGFITRRPAEKNIKRMPIPTNGATPQHALQHAYDFAVTNYPGANETFITPNTARDATIRIFMRYPYTLVRKQNTLYFNARTGGLAGAELYKNYTGYDMVARSNFDFHTGRIRALGIGSKIIYFLSALVAASLPVTGFLIWWGKRKKKKAVHTKNTDPLKTERQDILQRSMS